jgi:hypothetical protein
MFFAWLSVGYGTYVGVLVGFLWLEDRIWSDGVFGSALW